MTPHNFKHRGPHLQHQTPAGVILVAQCGRQIRYDCWEGSVCTRKVIWESVCRYAAQELHYYALQNSKHCYDFRRTPDVPILNV